MTLAETVEKATSLSALIDSYQKSIDGWKEERAYLWRCQAVQGMSLRTIARLSNVSHQTVANHLKEV